METKFEVKTYEIDYVCDICQKSYMRPTGKCLPSYPPQYQHKCSACGHTKLFKNTYPYIAYERTTN